ncbi:hypothetical protein Pelo_6216 [Pelomyxa schiedti]|nr:hypothetical protein Pelo_6216 [Pelomyxa schiedti]
MGGSLVVLGDKGGTVFGYAPVILRISETLGVSVPNTPDSVMGGLIDCKVLRVVGHLALVSGFRISNSERYVGLVDLKTGKKFSQFSPKVELGSAIFNETWIVGSGFHGTFLHITLLDMQWDASKPNTLILALKTWSVYHCVSFLEVNIQQSYDTQQLTAISVPFSSIPYDLPTPICFGTQHILSKWKTTVLHIRTTTGTNTQIFSSTSDIMLNKLGPMHFAICAKDQIHVYELQVDSNNCALCFTCSSRSAFLVPPQNAVHGPVIVLVASPEVILEQSHYAEILDIHSGAIVASITS